MARRRSSSRSRSDDADGALGLVLLAALGAAYRFISGVDWRLLLIGTSLTLSIVFLVVRLLVLRARRRERERLALADARSLSPGDFERRVAMLLEDLGWEQVRRVGGSGDGGVDIRGLWEDQRTIVQCKRYSGVVNPTHVRDLAGTQRHEGAARALLVTTGHFSAETQHWAAQNAVNVWDGAELARRIAHAEHAKQQPEAQRSERRSRRTLVGLVVVNGLVVVLALALPSGTIGWAAASAPARAASPAPAHTSPTAGVAPFAAVEPALSPTPTPLEPQLEAAVFNGGNMRARPSLQAAVVDQIHVGETVALWERTADDQWLYVKNARGVTGWVHHSLLTLDAATFSQVPTVHP